VPSSLRTFSVFAISESSPITGERGKLQVVALSVSSNLFDPTTQNNQLHLTLEIDAVRGLGGTSSNHRFFALTARRILEPGTLEPLTTVYGATEIAPRNYDSLVSATVVDEWDGTDDSGVTLEDLKAYPSDLSVAVVKLYAGNGVGPTPAWKPSALGLSHEQIAEMMMVVGMFDVPAHPVLNVLVDWVRRDIVFVSGPFARIVSMTNVVLAAFDPTRNIAQSCGEAYVACVNTTIDPENCQACYEKCKSYCDDVIHTCRWPDNAGGGNGLVCGYCNSPFCLLEESAAACLANPSGSHESSARAPCPQTPVLTKSTIYCDRLSTSPGEILVGYKQYVGTCTYSCADSDLCVRPATVFEVQADNCYTPMPRATLDCVNAYEIEFCPLASCADHIAGMVACKYQCQSPHQAVSCLRYEASCENCESMAACEDANP